ncbi:MAG: adenylate/guanylate cyclase domain-containing protein [Hyphomicrobiales bacterium]
MQCPACRAENRDGRKFCAACGATLAPLCAACGARNEPGERFCGECGRPLATGDGRRSRAGRDGERRQLTVMFCDLVGSTSISERLDPEEMREVLTEYQAVAHDVISRFGGRIAHYMGDGLLVYFGYPRAYGDDARRAVQTGLSLVTAVQQLDARLRSERGLDVAVRIGIHTGIAVIGTMGRGEARQLVDVVGETPNVASRLQMMAEGGSILISESTHRIVEEFFECESLGPQRLRGLSRPMEVHRVVREVPRRLEPIASGRRVTVLVGRAEETRILAERWREVVEGAGRIVLLRGEAGIGKSRLVQVLRDHAARDEHLRIEFQCSAYHQDTPLYPLIEFIKRTLGFRREDTDDIGRERLRRALQNQDLPGDFFPLFAQLLDLPLGPSASAGAEMASDRVRHETLRALMTWFDRLRAQLPVLFVVEDLHWIDPSTLELLTNIIQSDRTGHSLMLFTYRPEFVPPWPEDPAITTINLPRLGAEDVRQIVMRVTGGHALPPEVLQRILSRTDGVPLFVEEVTRNVLESGIVKEKDGELVLARGIQAMAVPTTLHDSLMARLDRLNASREVAHLASALGREFTYEMLRAVASLDDDVLQRNLNALLDADIIYERGEPPNARYVFRHALIQEVAYGSLLKSTRQWYHERIARTIEAEFPQIARSQPEVLARHYSEAQLHVEAAQCWLHAGQRAIEACANLEAIEHLRRGLEQIPSFTDETERLRSELELQVALGAALMAARGYAADEVQATYQRARELCDATNDSRHLFSVLRGLFSVAIARANYGKALQFAEQMLSVAQAARHPALLLGARIALGQVLFWMGFLPAARDHLREALGYYDFDRHSPRGARSGQDPGTTAMLYLALSLGAMGATGEGRRMIADALALAERCQHPFTIAFAHAHAAFFYVLVGQGVEAEHHARHAMALSDDHNFPMWAGVGSAFLGAALAADGEMLARGHLNEGLARLRGIGALLTFPIYLSGLGVLELREGRPDRAEAHFAEAQEALERTNERLYEPELLRLQAECALHRENASEAIELLEKAITSAQARGAALFELRATVALGALEPGRLDPSRIETLLGCFDSTAMVPEWRAASDLYVTLLAGS